MRRIFLAIAVCAVLGSAVRGVAAEPQAQENRDADLQTMTSFFLPSAPMYQFLRGTCEQAYRNQLTNAPGLVANDELMPGLIDHMVATAVKHCEGALPGWIQEIRFEIGRDWSARVTPAENSRLAKLFKPDVDLAEAIQVHVASGQTAVEMAQTARQSFRLTDAQERDFVTRQNAFAATPGGKALLQKISAFQTELKGKQDEQFAGLEDIIRAAVRAAKASANEYSRQKGYSDIYPVAVPTVDQG